MTGRRGIRWWGSTSWRGSGLFSLLWLVVSLFSVVRLYLSVSVSVFVSLPLPLRLSLPLLSPPPLSDVQRPGAGGGVHLGIPQLLALLLSSARAQEMLSKNEMLKHAFQAPTTRQDIFPGRPALEALVARHFSVSAQDPVALSNCKQSAACVLRAVLAATEVVLRMAPAMAAQRRAEVHARGTGSGLLALRLAAVEGRVELTRCLLTHTRNRRLANVALHNDPAAHLAAESAGRRLGATRGNSSLQLEAEGEGAGAHERGNGSGGVGCGGSRHVTCLALALACGQLEVARQLVEAGADAGHGWGTQHGVTLATAGDELSHRKFFNANDYCSIAMVDNTNTNTILQACNTKQLCSEHILLLSD